MILKRYFWGEDEMKTMMVGFQESCKTLLKMGVDITPIRTYDLILSTSNPIKFFSDLIEFSYFDCPTGNGVDWGCSEEKMEIEISPLNFVVTFPSGNYINLHLTSPGTDHESDWAIESNIFVENYPIYKIRKLGILKDWDREYFFLDSQRQQTIKQLMGTGVLIANQFYFESCTEENIKRYCFKVNGMLNAIRKEGVNYKRIERFKISYAGKRWIVIERDILGDEYKVKSLDTGIVYTILV